MTGRDPVNGLHDRRSIVRLGLSTLVAPGIDRMAVSAIEPRERMPERYHRVILRLDPDGNGLARSLRYEGNNLDLRGPRTSSGLFRDDGEVVSARWRRAASGCAGIFVLRDSLWSQQDHPTRHRAHAPLLPPNWITAAALAVHDGPDARLPLAPEIEDDAAWKALRSPAAMFGIAPRSEAWHRVATTSAAEGSEPERRMALNARRTALALGTAFRRMVADGEGDPAAVIRSGAEIACASDRRYFTAGLRRSRIIPITVTRPDHHEIEEGKGFHTRETATHPEATAFERMVRRTLLRRRLQDGDIALERYDISRPEEREAVAEILAELVPEADPVPGGGRVWVWVNGPLDPLRKLRGEDATRWIERLRLELGSAPIDLGRVRFLSKPSVELPQGRDRRDALDEAVDRFASLDLPLSLGLRTEAFSRIIE